MKKLKTKWTVTFQSCQGLQLWNFRDLSPLEYKFVTNSEHYQSKIGTWVSLCQAHSSSLKPLSVTTEENNKQNHPSNSNLIMFQSPKFCMPICTWSPTNFGESKSCLMVKWNFFYLLILGREGTTTAQMSLCRQIFVHHFIMLIMIQIFISCSCGQANIVISYSKLSFPVS